MRVRKCVWVRQCELLYDSLCMGGVRLTSLPLWFEISRYKVDPTCLQDVPICRLPWGLPALFQWLFPQQRVASTAGHPWSRLPQWSFHNQRQLCLCLDKPSLHYSVLDSTGRFGEKVYNSVCTVFWGWPPLPLHQSRTAGWAALFVPEGAASRTNRVCKLPSACRSSPSVMTCSVCRAPQLSSGGCWVCAGACTDTREWRCTHF